MARAPNVILVHGAWADGSSWSKVIPLLLARGLAVTAVQLPLTSLVDDVATVERAIALVDGPAVLVGHCYGGVVISEAGTESRITGLVYIAAFAPDFGQSAGSLSRSMKPAPVNGAMRPDPYGFVKLTEAGVKEDLAQDLTASEQAILFVTQAPTAAAALGGNVSAPAWRAKPSWYLVATHDRAIQPDLERRMARAIKAKTIEVEASHAAILARPNETAALIVEACA